MPSHAGERLRRAQELYAAGLPVEAEGILRSLLAEQPDHAEAWKGLGLAQRRQGRTDEAIASYERALKLAPQDAETHVNLAVALRTSRQLERAIAHLETAIRLQPRLAAAYLNLGNCQLDSQNLDQAGAAYLQCLRLDPASSGAAVGLSKVFREQRRFDLAERTLRTAAARNPDDPEIAATLGALLHDIGRDSEALVVLDKALTHEPRHPVALYYAGNLRHDLGQWEEAEGFYHRALDVAPEHADARINLADTVAELGRLPEAQRLLDIARATQGNDPDVRYACGIVSLSHGDFAAGWPDIASNVRTAKRKPTRFAHLTKLAAPEFDGRKVVIWGDQGIGDEILHGSFLQDLRAHAPRIVCEVDRRLAPLFSRGLPELTFVPRTAEPAPPAPMRDEEWRRIWRGAALDERLAEATHHIPLPDLGAWLRPDFASFPAHPGYLKADEARVAGFRARLEKSGDDLLIGLSWSSHNKDIGRHKSLGLRRLLDALPASSRLRFVNLQYGPVADEIAAVREATGRSVEVFPDLDCFADIDGLAALIAACDAVVTVSNVTAHLAGGLGQKVGLLCPLGLGRPWYWFSGRSDSPWYPSMRIFRQTRDASWDQALAGCAAWVSSLSP